jgi:hypothetical protein
MEVISSNSITSLLTEIVDEDECCICLEPPVMLSSLDSCIHTCMFLTRSASAKIVDCYECIFRWSKNSKTCPRCRARFNAITKIPNEEVRLVQQRMSEYNKLLN